MSSKVVVVAGGELDVVNAGDFAHVLDLEAIAGGLIGAVADEAEESNLSPVPPLRIVVPVPTVEVAMRSAFETVGRLNNCPVIGGGACAQQTGAGLHDDSGGHIVVAVIESDGRVDGVGRGGKSDNDGVGNIEAGTGVGRGAIVDDRAEDRAVVGSGVDRGLDARVMADEIFVAGNVAGGEIAGKVGVAGGGIHLRKDGGATGVDDALIPGAESLVPVACYHNVRGRGALIAGEANVGGAVPGDDGGGGGRVGDVVVSHGSGAGRRGIGETSGVVVLSGRG